MLDINHTKPSILTLEQALVRIKDLEALVASLQKACNIIGGKLDRVHVIAEMSPSEVDLQESIIQELERLKVDVYEEEPTHTECNLLVAALKHLETNVYQT